MNEDILTCLLLKICGTLSVLVAKEEMRRQGVTQTIKLQDIIEKSKKK